MDERGLIFGKAGSESETCNKNVTKLYVDFACNRDSMLYNGLIDWREKPSRVESEDSNGILAKREYESGMLSIWTLSISR